MKKRIYLAAIISWIACGLALAQSGAIADNNYFSKKENENNRIELYPNPAVDYLIVEITNSSLQNTSFEMHSIIGNELRIEAEEIGPNKFRIPLKEFSSGYYFLVIKDEISRFKKAYKFLKN